MPEIVYVRRQKHPNHVRLIIDTIYNVVLIDSVTVMIKEILNSVKCCFEHAMLLIVTEVMFFT